MLRPLLAFSSTSLTTSITGSMPLADLRINRATITPLADGSQILGTDLGLLRIASGQVLLVSNVYLTRFVAFDPSTGGVATLNYGPYFLYSSLRPNDPPALIARQRTDGSSAVIYAHTSPTDASGVNLAFTPTGALAVGPDGTIFFGDATPGAKAPFGRILALAPNGAVRLVTTTNSVPRSLALDSKGTLYFVPGDGSRQISKVPAAGGTPVTAYTSTFGSPLALGLDAQDRLYFLSDDISSPVTRIDTDGTQHNIFTQGGFNIFSGLQQGVNLPTAPALTVSPDGTLYAGISARFSDTASTILKLSPSGSFSLIPMESYFPPGAMASPSASGTFIAYGGKVLKIQPDGTIITVFGSDNAGFHDEHGFDSEPGGIDITGIAIGSDGNVIVTDSASGTVRRINVTGCTLRPTPVIEGIADSAIGSSSLRRAAGQLLSIYGKRLGPVTGVIAKFDTGGYLPTGLAGVRVLVNGAPAPLLYVSAAQINAIVPFAVDGQGSGRISVQYNGALSDDLAQFFGYYGPAIFNIRSVTGSGLGTAVMLNQDGTLNSQTNPAHAGSVVTIYATGTGNTSPEGEDAKQAGGRLKYTAQPVGILVDGEPAEVLYAGSAPYLVEGTTQINFRIPSSAQNASAVLSLTMGTGLGYAASSYLFFAGK